MKILHLTLKKQWYDMIVSGEKKEEYREIKQYWINRFAICGGKDPRPFGYYCQKASCFSCVTRGDGFRPKEFDTIRFTNGYSKGASTFDIECKGITIGTGNPQWGAPAEQVFILSLGKIL